MLITPFRSVYHIVTNIPIDEVFGAQVSPHIQNTATANKSTIKKTLSILSFFIILSPTTKDQWPIAALNSFHSSVSVFASLR